MGLDPLATSPGRTIQAIFGTKFLEFAIPGLLEGLVEQLVHVLERDMLRGTAARRHMCWVGDGEGENPGQAGVAHAVFAREESRFVDGDRIGPARQAGYLFRARRGADGEEGGK